MAAKKPADRKNARHPKSEKFVFEADDISVKVPYIENLPMHAVLELQGSESEAEATRAMVDLLFGDQEDEFRKFSIGDFIDFQEKWNKESSISLGEL